MRIVYFGTGSFAVPTLRALSEHVALVVSQPDRPSGRGMKLQATEVKLEAEKLGLTVETPERARNPEFAQRIRAIGADALVVASYGQILPQALLDAAKRGAINLHGSILPEYRGAAPIQRCLLDGRTETGVTLMQMDAGMDTGDAIAIEKLAIDPDETYGELQVRLAQLAAKMAASWLPQIASGLYPRTPQDHARASMAPKTLKHEAELSFDRDSLNEYDRFRAFTPSPGAFLLTSHGRLKISSARRIDGTGSPGEVLNGGAGCAVAFQSGALDLLEVQPEGKKRMSGKDFLNGSRLKPGASLR
jgi:methionyl-tRNA formyltransferase